MRVLCHAVLIVAAFVTCNPLLAADETSAKNLRATAAAPTSFIKPAVYRGTLGEAAIQMNLRPKEPAEDGIEGDYFLFGGSQKVLLAGEADGGELFLEESENGTDVSGQWAGKLDADTLHGEWTSADGSVSKPFALKLVRSDGKQKQMPASAAQQKATAAGASTGPAKK